jgi:small-conductance mechanosensitive channel
MEINSGKLISLGSTVLIFGILLYISNASFKKLLTRKNSLVFKFLKSAVNITILFVGIYSVMAQFDIARDISAAILQSGTLIIAVLTFAAQQALGNVISGFSISASRPLEVGQKVKIVHGSSTVAEGIVQDMTVRHVVIAQYDGQTCIIPNSVVDQSVIINTNYTKQVGNFLFFEISYTSSIEKARELIYKNLAEEELVCQKHPGILVSSVSSNGMILKFTVWTETVDENFIACSNLREHIVRDFMANGIEIPYNTVDVNMRKEEA